jgi:hypothetical protein
MSKFDVFMAIVILFYFLVGFAYIFVFAKDYRSK